MFARALWYFLGGGVVGVGVIVMCWDRNFVGLLDWIEVERFRERE